MLKRRRRAGLLVFEEFSTSDPLETMPQMSEEQRLAWAEEQLLRYPHDVVLRREVAWVRDHIHQQSIAVVFALDSIMRGIWLLDTGQYLQQVLQAQRQSETNSKNRLGKRGRADNNRTKDSDADIFSFWQKMKAEFPNYTALTAQKFSLSTRRISTIVKLESERRKQPR